VLRLTPADSLFLHRPQWRLRDSELLLARRLLQVHHLWPLLGGAWRLEMQILQAHRPWPLRLVV
jgi:hypothetical protein